MVPVNFVYKTLLTLANSAIRGNLTPTEFNLLVQDSVEEIYEEYLAEINRLTNRENRGLMNGGLENLPNRLREKIQYFLKNAALTFSAPNFILPTDLRYIDSIYYNGINEVELCKTAREFKIVSGFSHTTPSLQMPLGLRRGETLQIAPSAIINGVTMEYLRNPVPANWTFIVIGGAEVYNPSSPDARNIDLHVSETNNVIVRTAKRFGINLREQELAAIEAAEQTADTNLENQT